MTPGRPVFVDTNVLIYANRRTVAEHAISEAALRRFQAEQCELWISHQVLREYLANVTRPQAASLPIGMIDAIADITRFRSLFNVADDTPAVFDRLLILLGLHTGSGKQVHDANLVATMLTQGITCLFTFDAADFRRFGSLIELVAP